MSEQNTISLHWADIYADKIVREKGMKDVYTCASGITPSGTVHIGNFREIISVELIVRALRDHGHKVRFIYSWDDYDVFRKVPKNMPEPELLKTYLRKPITSVPDTTGKWESYAQANEKAVEQLLPVVGVEPEYIYQAQRYQSSVYAEGMKTALEHRMRIKEILDRYRTEPLPDDWYPVSVFSRFTGKDTTTVVDWDGDWNITYKDDETGQVETIDLKETGAAKLPWRIDWPMRWAYEDVDFEPAGKDHHSEGGSFDTSKHVVEVFGHSAPVSFQYDFISIKGRGGKISSSSGEVISLEDVLEVYTPEVTRFLFVGTRPNTEFAISFDLDVLKIYEDYDTCERIYFGLQQVNEKRLAKEKRIYELSQVREVPTEISYQIPFRHLCNLLQIHSGDIDAVITALGNVAPGQVDRLRQRCACAWNWITQFAPEDFRWTLSPLDSTPIEIEAPIATAIKDLAKAIESMDISDEKALAEEIYAVATRNQVEATELFKVSYMILIGKERGPKLAGFIKSCGKEKILPILNRYA
ncbi:MAG: lysine--tRNA ligase [Sphaerochaetaceae bacterium]|jgi:lysyl-tRNA synthetase class 1|nr:lysine--tRNA ligase [Sphaerochaetaceae bacterium]NLO60127.1 lysine--tRNA ligase [Spirochaetales bacterium]MDD2406096.1 lysine--tRNA ligase [Sphaerochaetaceae bacterium]MDD3670076.1 lysine--tRNA ligase [Sphaerochaetaceae bacterium]MDD4260244.1 lysine--tRNA ligase [Sphaerochaetaceae bacterium]